MSKKILALPILFFLLLTVSVKADFQKFRNITVTNDTDTTPNLLALTHDEVFSSNYITEYSAFHFYLPNSTAARFAFQPYWCPTATETLADCLNSTFETGKWVIIETDFSTFGNTHDLQIYYDNNSYQAPTNISFVTLTNASFYDHFENESDGTQPDNWNDGLIVNYQAAKGLQSVYFVGGGENIYTSSIFDSPPEYISWWVRWPDPDGTDGYIRVNTETGPIITGYTDLFGGAHIWNVRAIKNSVDYDAGNYTLDKWYHFEIKNISLADNYLDIYWNGTKTFSGAQLEYVIEQLTSISLQYSEISSRAYYDEFYIGNEIQHPISSLSEEILPPIISNCSLNPNVIYESGYVTFTIYLEQTTYSLDKWSIHPTMNPPCEFEEDCQNASGMNGTLFEFMPFIERGDSPYINVSMECWVNDTHGNNNSYIFGYLAFLPPLCFLGNTSGSCCIDPDHLYTKDYYGANGTFYTRTETIFCNYGCDTALNICKLPPIFIIVIFVLVLAAIAYIIKKFW